MGVVPSPANDLAIGMDLPDQIFRINLWLRIVLANAIFVVRIKSFSNFGDVAQTHGPKIGIPFVHGAIIESRTERIVVVVIDTMAVFVPNHICDQGSWIAPSSGVVKIDTDAIIEGIALPFYINVCGH